jgi:hypothetical protein
LSLPPSLPLRSAAIGKIRNLNHAQKVLNMALRINDLAAAWCVVSGMEQNFRWPAQRRLVTSIRRYVDGVAFLYGGDCARAVSNLQSCAELKQFPSRGRLFDAYLKLAESSWRKGDARTAREASAAALALQPNDALALFNAGVIAWSTGRLSADKPARGDGCLSAPDGSGRTEADALMRRFLTRAMQGAIVRPESIRIAEAILAGACTNRPPLLAPSLPPLLKSRASPTEASADPGGSRR